MLSPQEELDLRASMLRVPRLAAAARSHSSPLFGLSDNSSSASSSKPSSRESSEEQPAALLRAATLGNPAAPGIQLDAALDAAYDAAAAAVAEPNVEQEARSELASPFAARACRDTNLNAGSCRLASSAAAPSVAAAAADGRCSALYSAAASALQGTPNAARSRPRVTFAAAVEGSSSSDHEGPAAEQQEASASSRAPRLQEQPLPANPAAGRSNSSSGSIRATTGPCSQQPAANLAAQCSKAAA